MTISLLKFLIYYKNIYNKTICIYKYNYFVKQILDIFWDKGIIFGYRIKNISNELFFIIYLKSLVLKKIKFFSLSSKRKQLKLPELSKIIKKEQGFSFFIISNNYGILEGFKSVKNGSGGELICKITF